MKKIAICIPTYNRKKILKDICIKIINTVDKNFCDVYIYDSSPSEDTEKELIDLIENNKFIFYQRVPENTHSSKKLYNVYQNEFIQKNYKYLWILPDYLFFSKRVIELLIKKLEENWDMLMLDFYDPQKQGDKQYYDPNQIFYEYAWSLTQFGIIILNCETVLKKADWKYLENKYLTEKYQNFSHILMYFEMMIKIDDLKFFHLSIPQNEAYRSIYRGDKPEYLKNFLKVWGYCWYESIYALPDYYCHKEQVVKMACIYTRNLSIQNLSELRRQGVLIPETFKEYIHIWKAVSTVPVFCVWILMKSPKCIVGFFAEYGSLREGIPQLILLMRLKRFCKKYDEIYLYGAGKKAESVAEFLNKKSILFDGFVVTDLNNNKNYLDEHKVIEISQLSNSSKIGIIIALNEKNKREVVPLLKKKGYKNLFQKSIV